MGKKYVVEIGRLERLYKASISAKGMPNMTWLSPEVDLTPYTEPDLEQVRKAAYDKGYADAKCGYENGFENGMIVAWDAAKKLYGIDWDDLCELFGKVSVRSEVLDMFTASEAIEKIRQYEQRQEEHIQVGDEVIPRETEYDTMIVTRLWKDDYDSDCIDAIGFDGRISSFLVSRVSKTGKHYEIAAVLEKMREGQDE